jgi:hypothetical protein
MAFNKMHAGWMHPRLVYLGFVVSAITYLTLRRARHKAQQRVDRRITIDHALDLLDSLIVTVLVTTVERVGSKLLSTTKLYRYFEKNT